MRPRWFGLLLLIAALLAPAAPAPGRIEELEEDLEVTWKVRHALGGVHRRTGFVAVAVEIDNPTGEDRRLMVQGGAWEPDVQRSVELPARSRKAFTFYLNPAGYRRSYQMGLRDERGYGLARHDLTSISVDPGVRIIGLMGPRPMGTGALRADENYQVVHLEPAILPSRAEGLRSLDAIVWTDPRIEALDPGQVRAVASWVEAGGSLVLGVNDIWLESSTGGLDAWTRVRARSTRAVRRLPSLAAEGGRPLNLDDPVSVAILSDAAGEVWLRERGGALAVVERRGRGRVMVLGFDPTDRPLARWEGMERVWPALLSRAGMRPPDPDEAKGYGGYNYYLQPLDLRSQSWNILSRVEGLEGPPLTMLVVVLVVYLLLIGPVDYFVLKRLRRLAWTWVTYPLLVLLFTVGAYAVARGSRSGETRLQHIVVADLLPLSDSWAMELHGSFFATEMGRYHLTPLAGGGIPVGNTEERSGAGRGYSSFGQWARLEATTDQGVPSVSARTPKWGSLAGTFLRHTPAQGAHLEADLRVRGRRLSGEILPRLGRNFSGSAVLLLHQEKLLVFDTGPLHDATPLGMQGARGRPFDLDPGSVTRLPWSEQEGRPEPVFRDLLFRQTARRAAIRGSGKDGRNPDDDWFLRGDPHPWLDWSGLLEEGGAVLVAWGRDTGPRLMVEGREETPGSGTVYVRAGIGPERVTKEGPPESTDPEGNDT